MKKYIGVLVLGTGLLLGACSSTEVETKPEAVDGTTATVNTQELTKAEPQPKLSPEQTKVKASMLDMMKRGVPLTCTFFTDDEGTKINATMQVDGKQISYKGEGEVEGKKMEMHMVMKDGFTYSWTNMAPGTGFKMKANLDENPADAKDSEMGAEEFHKEFDFDCREGVESSAFDIPSDIQFQEFAMPNIPSIQ